MIMIRQIHPVVGLVLVIQERQAVKTNYCNCKTCWDLSSSHPFHPKFGKRKAICKINLQNMAEHDFNDVQKLVRSQLVVNPNYSGERGWNIFRTSTAEIFLAHDIMTYFLFFPAQQYQAAVVELLYKHLLRLHDSIATSQTVNIIYRVSLVKSNILLAIIFAAQQKSIKHLISSLYIQKK